MDKLKVYNGGHPVKLNEFDLLQDSYLEGFYSLIYKMFPSGNGILKGCEITISDVNSTVAITDGYIAIDGEIFQVNASAEPFTFSNVSTLYFAIQENALDERVYENREANKVHLQRLAIFKVKEDSDTQGIYYEQLSSSASVLEGSIIPWHIPEPKKGFTKKTIDFYFDETGLGINSALGYAICNGLNGTPDLRGMFLAMNTTNTFNTATLNPIVNNLGSSPDSFAGQNLSSLSKDNLPPHDHNVNDNGHTHGTDSTHYFAGDNLKGNNVGSGTQVLASDRRSRSGLLSSKTNITIGITGSGTPIDRRPATYYLYYITPIA